MSTFAVVVVVMLAVAQSAFAQFPSSPRDATRLAALRPAQSNPYGKLFAARSFEQPTRDPRAPDQPKRRVVCGLTIVHGDPTIDPKFAVANRNDAVDYTLRIIDPPTCKP
jgi:hypothetical protein